MTVRPGVLRVKKSGQPLALEPKSIGLLVYLVEHRPRAIGKEELLHEIWADAAVNDNAPTRVVAQLRKALSDDAKVARCIETTPTLGYRFIADVTAVAAGPQVNLSRLITRRSVSPIAMRTKADPTCALETKSGLSKTPPLRT